MFYYHPVAINWIPFVEVNDISKLGQIFITLMKWKLLKNSFLIHSFLFFMLKHLQISCNFELSKWNTSGTIATSANYDVLCCYITLFGTNLHNNDCHWSFKLSTMVKSIWNSKIQKWKIPSNYHLPNYYSNSRKSQSQHKNYYMYMKPLSNQTLIPLNKQYINLPLCVDVTYEYI